MKTVAALFLIWFCHAARGEELAVFTCKATMHDVKPAIILSGLKEGEHIPIVVYEPGKRVGILNTGKKSFASIYEAGLGWSADRLLGDGSVYLLKSKSGVYYGIFMEYGPIDQRYNGRLYKMGKFSDLSSNAAVFIGELYESGGVDPLILKQLRSITQRVETRTAANAARSK